jgi:hypothetical protein
VATRRFFTQALNTTKIAPVEVITDKAAGYRASSMSWPS